MNNELWLTEFIILSVVNHSVKLLKGVLQAIYIKYLHSYLHLQIKSEILRVNYENTFMKYWVGPNIVPWGIPWNFNFIKICHVCEDYFYCGQLISYFCIRYFHKTYFRVNEESFTSTHTQRCTSKAAFANTVKARGVIVCRG